jgi:hypothetical protein
MDTVVWLRSLGLGQNEAAFRESEIDETVLPNLAAEDLKDLGVGIVGHRRKLLDAIAALRHRRERENALRRFSAPPSTSAVDRAERRQVMVMFSDLPSWNPFSWPYWRTQRASVTPKFGNLWIREFSCCRRSAPADRHGRRAQSELTLDSSRPPSVK